MTVHVIWREDVACRTCGDLYIHRAAIARLLAPWFARRTVTDLTAAFTGTSVPWALLHNLTGDRDATSS